MSARRVTFYILISACVLAPTMSISGDHPCPCGPWPNCCGNMPQNPQTCMPDIWCFCHTVYCANGFRLTNTAIRTNTDPSAFINCETEGCAGFCFTEGNMLCGQSRECEPGGPYNLCNKPSQCCEIFGGTPMSWPGWWLISSEPCCDFAV